MGWDKLEFESQYSYLYPDMVVQWMFFAVNRYKNLFMHIISKNQMLYHS